MAHELKRLSRELLDKPQLVTLNKFEEIADVLEGRNPELFKLALDKSKDPVDKRGLSIENGIGILTTDGPLTYKPTFFSALCGGASYEGLLREMNTLASNDEVHTVLHIVDSPGGEAYRAFETSRQLRKIADENGIKLITYIDGLAASAGYALAISSHEVVINPSAEAGSIGVVIRLQNTNKADKKKGKETTYITAGDSKVPFEESGEFREEFLEGLQERVTELYGEFVTHVASMRSISEETVIGTQAKVFSANKSLELGLVDKVMESEEFFEYLSSLQDNKRINSSSNRINANVNEGRITPTEIVSVNNEDGESMSLDTQGKGNANLSEEITEDKVKTEAIKGNTELSSEMSALMDSFEERLASMELEKSTLQADNERLAEEASKLATDKADLATTLKNDKLAKLKANASSWGFAGVDAESYAASAIDGSVPVSMFNDAMTKASLALSTSAGMAEIGATSTADETVEEESGNEDGVLAALKSTPGVTLK